jgi:hypothetical protein
VNCDIGLAVCSEWVFSPELRSGKVVAILEDWSLPPTNLSVVYPTGRLACTKARIRFLCRAGHGSLNSASPQRERSFIKSFKKELRATSGALCRALSAIALRLREFAPLGFGRRRG